MTHCMIDIETAGTTPGNAILEIAAARFDPVTGAIFSEWSAAIDILDSVARRMTMDPETAAFHLRKGFAGSLRGTPLFRAFNALDLFLNHQGGPLTVWAWGMDFERPMVEAAASAAGLPMPWQYWQGMDARSVWALAFPGQKHPPRPHRAKEDVRAQINDLAKALQKIGVTTL